MVPRAYGPILCRIVESNVATTGIRRFKYVVREVTIGDASNTVIPTDVPNGFEYNKVWNLAELANDANYSSGLYRPGLPGTFKLQAVENDAIVAVYVSSSSNGNVWAFFNRAGEFDGECTDPLTDGGDGDGGGGGGSLTGTVWLEATGTMQASFGTGSRCDGNALNITTNNLPVTWPTSLDSFIALRANTHPQGFTLDVLNNAEALQVQSALANAQIEWTWTSGSRANVTATSGTLSSGGSVAGDRTLFWGTDANGTDLWTPSWSSVAPTSADLGVGDSFSFRIQG